LNNQRLEEASIGVGGFAEPRRAAGKLLGLLNAPATKLVTLINTPATCWRRSSRPRPKRPNNNFRFEFQI
jgi:hypothetical protein